MPPHRAQLLVCHELIAGPMENNRVRGEDQYCSLSAYAWCFDDNKYVCDIHLNSMHDGCNTAIEYPRQTFEPGEVGRPKKPKRKGIR